MRVPHDGRPRNVLRTTVVLAAAGSQDRLFPDKEDQRSERRLSDGEVLSSRHGLPGVPGRWGTGQGGGTSAGAGGEAMDPG